MHLAQKGVQCTGLMALVAHASEVEVMTNPARENHPTAIRPPSLLQKVRRNRFGGHGVLADRIGAGGWDPPPEQKATG